MRATCQNDQVRRRKKGFKAERSGRGRVAALCKAGCPVAAFHGKARKAHQSRKECAGGRGTRLAEKSPPPPPPCPL